MNAHLQQTRTQPHITNSVQLSSLESLQHFSSLSNNPPSLTTPPTQTASPPPYNPSACRERDRAHIAIP